MEVDNMSEPGRLFVWVVLHSVPAEGRIHKSSKEEALTGVNSKNILFLRCFWFVCVNNSQSIVALKVSKNYWDIVQTNFWRLIHKVGFRSVISNQVVWLSDVPLVLSHHPDLVLSLCCAHWRRMMHFVVNLPSQQLVWVRTASLGCFHQNERGGYISFGCSDDNLEVALSNWRGAAGF